MKQMTNLLGLYGGCDSDELRRIRKLPSRWVALCTTFPSIVLYEKGCYLLHGDQPIEEKAVGKKRPAIESGISAAPKAQKTGSGYGAAGGGESESESD
jgi:hypothetical protein